MNEQTPLLNLTNKLSTLRASLNENEQALLDQLILNYDDENDVQAHGGGGRTPILLEENQYVLGGGGFIPGGGGMAPGGGGMTLGGGG